MTFIDPLVQSVELGERENPFDVRRTAPGPLTSRIWGVPMRAARRYGLGARIADVRREQSIKDAIEHDHIEADIDRYLHLI